MKWILGVLLGAAVSANLYAKASCSDQYFNEAWPVVQNQKLAASVEGLCFKSFGVQHSSLTRTPLVAGEHLTRDRVLAALKLGRNDSFHEESRLPASARSTLSDYRRSGYDRGHLASLKDQPDEESQYESFSLANIVPQWPSQNQGIWEQ